MQGQELHNCSSPPAWSSAAKAGEGAAGGKGYVGAEPSSTQAAAITPGAALLGSCVCWPRTGPGSVGAGRSMAQAAPGGSRRALAAGRALWEQPRARSKKLSGTTCLQARFNQLAGWLQPTGHILSTLSERNRTQAFRHKCNEALSNH